MKDFYVYIMASFTRTIYIGVTSDLETRVHRHKQKLIPGFTCKYNVNRLVFAESLPDAATAFERETQIKGWRREKKIALIESINPNWDDLSQPPKPKRSLDMLGMTK
jgi:putative endonuclease